VQPWFLLTQRLGYRQSLQLCGYSPGKTGKPMIEKARHYRAFAKRGVGKWRRFALIAALVLAISLLLQLAFRHLFFYPLRIATDSMQPEIATGDKRYFTYPRLAHAKPGDVVLIRPAHADVQLLCRILAVDGDKISISEGRLYLNGKEIRALNFAVKSQADLSYHLQEVEVRPDYVFCLNDNASNTNDSRLHGSFNRRQIEAVMVKPLLFF
jgi:signal peptidase I